uniref:Uncharacterized protein n=1 Tax=Amphimedon queenslandica TaxID=400682 RepID=A0A1X7U5D6_AMPQE
VVLHLSVKPLSITFADDEDSSSIVEDFSISQERQDLIHSQNTSCGLSLKADRSKDMALACISHEMEDFYGYVFSKGHVVLPFSLFATYLRVKIEINATKLQESTIRRASTIFIKYNSGTLKPSQFYGQSTE